ncbi:MAG: hypothetical protein WAP55_00370 [Minisyncoccia bacterium]
MEIPPNILKELEEKKAKAVLSGAVAVEERGKMGEKGEMGPFIPPFPPLLTPLLEAEPHKQSGGEIFFDYLAKIAVFLAVFLTPLFFFNSSDTLNLPKQMLLSFLATVALGAWVAKTVAAGRVIWRKTILEWPILAVFAAAVLSSLFSSSFWVSFLGDTGRYSSAGLSVLAYIILAVVGLQTIRPIGPIGRIGDVKIAIGLWLTSVFLVSLHALAQFFGVYVIPGEAYQSRTFNTIGSPFNLALFILSSVPFILYLLQSAVSRKIKIILAVSAAVQLAAAAIIDFRIGWLALAASAMVLILMGFKKATNYSLPTTHYQQNILLPLAAIVVSVLLWLVRAPQIEDLVFPAEISPSYGASLDVLTETWKKTPVFGSGLETYPYVYAKFKNTSLNQTNYWGVNFNGSNASVITWATTSGILGTLAWLAFVVLFLKMSVRGSRGWQTGFAASWIFILVSKFFYATSLPLEFMFWFLPALFILQGGEKGEMGEKGWSYKFQTGSVKTLAAFFVLLVVLLGALAGGYFSVRRVGAELTFVKSVLTPVTLSESGQPESEKRDELINGLYAAVGANPYEPRYFRVLAQALFGKMNDVVAGINIRPEAERRAKPEESALLQDLTVRTINSVQRARALDPDNVSVAVDAAESYRSLVPLVQGADDLAIQNYERARDLEPINPFIKTQLGQLYLIKSNMFNQGLEMDAEYADKARAVLDAALKLNPNYANARYFYALIQDYDGLKQEALQNFLILRQTNPDNQLIAQIIANLERGFPALGTPPRPATPPQSPQAVETKGVPKE